MPHLLLVDDDGDIRSLLTRFFVQYGYTVDAASNGTEMLRSLATHQADIVILDVMLPGEDGFTLCQRLRATSSVPIIMLTARKDDTDRVVGLEIGADDYLGKPFNARELLARVRAVLRRTGERPRSLTADDKRPVLIFNRWRLDLARRELRSPENMLVPLSGGEFDLLLTFAEHPQRVLTRDQLLDLARGANHDSFDRSIDVQVSRLRRKLELDAKVPTLIRTVRNGGYIFTASVEQA